MDEVESALVFVSSNLAFLKYLLRCEAAMNQERERPVETNFGDLLQEPENQANRKRLILSTEEIIAHVATECVAKGSSLSIIHDQKNMVTDK